MALIDCPDCDHQVSDKAPTCPHCGVGIAKKESKYEARLSKAAKASQVVIALMIPAVGLLLTWVGMRDQKIQLAEQRRANDRAERAKKMIDVVDRLSKDDTKRAAAFLALSFFREKQLDPTIITLLVDEATDLDEEKVAYQDMRESIEKMIDETQEVLDGLNRRIAEERDELRKAELQAEYENLKQVLKEAANDLYIIRDPSNAEEKTETFKKAAAGLKKEDGSANLAKDQAKAVVQVAAAEVTSGTDTPNAGTPDLAAAAEELKEITGGTLEQAADDVGEGGEEALRKGNAILEGLVEAKKEAAAAVESAKQGGAKAGSESPDVAPPEERVEKAEKAQQDTTEAVLDVVQSVHEQSRKVLRDNAERREQVFDGLDIHRLVVAYGGQADLEEAKIIEEAILSFMKPKLGSDGEVVSVREDIPANRETVAPNIQQPDHNQLRYQAGDLESETIATRIADFLVNEHDLRFKLVALPASVIAKREYEYWFGTSGAPLPDAEAYVPAAAGAASAAASGTSASLQ